MDTKPKKTKRFNYKRSIIILMITVAVVILVSPMFMGRTCHGHDKGETINNAKQIGIALFCFQDELGSYPNESTVAMVNESYPDHGYDLTGTSSNALFRQLMATGITESEHMFFARITGSVRPDGNITPGEALKKGECNFAYISGLSPTGDPARPIVLTPVIPGTKKFDPKPFEGKAIILRTDSTASTYEIHEDGHVYDKDGIDMLSPTNPIWNGKAPDIRYPE